MLKKILSLFIAFAVLFSGCSNKRVYPKKDVQIYTFLTDKDESFYIFVSDKYSYIFEDKETVSELKEVIKLARSSGAWRLGDKPKIYLEKDLTAKIYMTLFIKAQVNQIDKLKSMGFKKSTKNSSFYFKDMKLIGKFGHTNSEIKEKFQKNYLSHPMLFEQIQSSEINDSNIPSALEVVGGILMAPVAVVGMLLFIAVSLVGFTANNIVDIVK
jgi:hypothetical protein